MKLFTVLGLGLLLEGGVLTGITALKVLGLNLSVTGASSVILLALGAFSIILARKVPYRQGKPYLIVVILLMAMATTGFAIYTGGQDTYACMGPCGGGELLKTSSVSCTQSGASLLCSLSISNDGNGGASASACSIILQGRSISGNIGGNRTFAPGSTVSFACRISGVEPPMGTHVTGSITLTNGDTFQFSTSWT